MGGCIRKSNQNFKQKLSERSIESLPVEVLLIIFKWFNFDDLMNVAKTCRLFETVAKKIFSQNISFTIDREMVDKGDKLTRLELNCNGTNLNGHLSQLARKGILEELILYSVEVDDLFFKTLKSFDMLQVLILSPSINSTIISPLWPVNLKQLQLYLCHLAYGSRWNFYFTLSFKAFLSTIQQLHYLEILNLSECEIVESDKVYFKDLEKLSHLVHSVMNHGVRKKRLCVVLPGNLGKGYARETFEADKLIIEKDEDYSQCRVL